LATGDDDFHVKVSPDGSTFHNAILISATTGEVTFPNTVISGSNAPPGGTTGQLQFNNASAFDGAAGTAWDTSKKQLRIDATAGALDTATLTLGKSGGASSVLDLEADYSGKVLRIFGPPDIANNTPVTYIGNGGEFKTRSYMVVSGSVSGTGDGYVINEPISTATYPHMLGVWSDVAYALTLRSFNANGGFNIVALDRNANFRFMMPEDGSLTFGPATATTPAGIDAGLSRTAAATLSVGNGTAGDASGTLVSARHDIAAISLFQGSSNVGGVPTIFAGDPGGVNATRGIVALAFGVGNGGANGTWDTNLFKQRGDARIMWSSAGDYALGTPDTGILRDSAGVLAVTDGSATLTNYRDLKLRDLYSGANKVLGARATGWSAATGTATRTTFDTATATTTQIAERLKALLDDLIAHGMIGA